MKNILKLGILLTLIVNSLSLFAQHRYLDTTWVASSPEVGVGNYRTSAIALPDNFLIVTGNAKNGNGDTDVYTFMLDNNGDTVWTAWHNGSAEGDDYGIGIIQRSDGDFIVAGTVKSLTSDYDYIAICYDDTTGSKEWTYVWDGDAGGIDISADLALDASDNVYLVGGTQRSNGLSDYGVVKISSSGSFIWEYYYDYNNLHDAATSIIVAGTRVIVSGGSNASLGDWDLATVRVNMDSGAEISVVRSNVAGATIEDARAMTTDSLNNIYITGFATVGGNSNMQTLKFDSTLALSWSANYDAAGFADEAYDIAVDVSGNVYVSGFSEQSSGKPQAEIIKYNSSGTLQWNQSYTSQFPVTSIARKMEISSTGDIFITGSITQDTLSSFFFNQYDSDGALQLSAEYDSDSLDENSYDIAIDSNVIYIVGLSQGAGGGSTNVLKYTLLDEVNPIYFYLNGEKSYWCQQAGMYSFSLTDTSQYIGYDPAIVTDSAYFVDGTNYVYFDESASNAQIDSMINIIESDLLFNKEYMVATLTRNNDKYHESEYFAGLDNQICIIFEDAELSITEIDSFATLYETEVIFEPAASIEGGVYILQPKRTISSYSAVSPTLTMEIARDMEEYDSLDFVKFVDPSMRMFRPDAPDDSLYNEMWWAQDSITYICNGAEVGPGSIDLDCAWNFEDEFGTTDYYSGDGIVVAVIDFDGVFYSHPDCLGMYGPGYVVFSQGSIFPIDTNIWISGTQFYTGHGQAVSGIIGARIDNDEGIAGVAHNSTVLPYLMQGGTDSFNTLLTKVLEQNGTENEVDVINMSFGFDGITVSEAQGFSFYNVLLQCYEAGRPDPTDPGNSALARGIPLIASTGDDNGNVSQIPAGIPFVLSVAATNPVDQLKTVGDGFDPTGGQWGSNYFNYVDVAAPGSCIWTTDFTQDWTVNPPQWGYDTTSNYYSFNGTSAAAPIVSGIAALVLEKDSMLTVDEVYDVIRFSCEKVGGYSYSNNWETGRCTELGYGRVNACKALNTIELLSDKEDLQNIGIKVTHPNPVNGLLPVSVNGTENYSVIMVNIMGEVVYHSDVNTTNVFEVDMSKFSNGLYLLKINDLDTDVSQTSKVIKY